MENGAGAIPVGGPKGRYGERRLKGFDLLELDSIVRQVFHNCNISDARHAGLYSICGLGLRLRDLFKWEKGLDPWVEKESSEVLDWIGEKEELWETLTDEDYGPITIGGVSHEPFDVEGINALLEPQGLIYGAGYAGSLKPTFFLARLECKRDVDGYPVYLLGRELARDLVMIPALSQGASILVRLEAAKLFLWDQIFFVRKSGRGPLRSALRGYGLDGDDVGAIRSGLARIAAEEVETYIRHELGELRDMVFEKEIWRRIIATFPHTPIELLARTVKDLLADTNEYGTLRHIVKEAKAASLAFYVAFLDGFRKVLFPELEMSFKEFEKSGEWSAITTAVTTGFERARHHAETLCRIFLEGEAKGDMAWVQAEVERSLLVPLGINGE
jgi:hypothetical protein